MSAFSDLRVLELGRVFSGPLCGMVLADLGARVIKVERPGVGDESRRFGRAEAKGCYFNALNRSKQSVALDLSDADDRALFVALVEEADVLVHNWVQESLDKLGFSWEEVHRLNPRLVYCAIGGFGAQTSFAARPSQDIIAQALSGFMSLTGERGGAPLKSAIPLVDYATGLYAAVAILGALLERQATGRGQRVRVSLLESAVAMTSFAGAEHLSTGAVPERTGNRHPSICPYNLYETADGHLVIAVANDEMWARFCRALGLDWLRADGRFTTNATRLAHQEALEVILGARMRVSPTAELQAALEREKVSCAPVNDLAQAFACAPVRELGMEVDLGEGVRFVGAPFHLDGSERAAPTPPPELGRDTEAVRRRGGW
ncbi:MAG: CoA transferase [Deltaproteobacteria bacterium]|nr:CoA transferase [Deltaproteobacteria bacterium]